MRFLLRALDFLFPPSRDLALVRRLTRESVRVHLRPLPLTIRAHPGAALLPYRTAAVGALIRQAKFSGSATAHALLADALDEYLESFLEDREAFEARTFALVPVPLSKKRFRERGYNQVDEVLKRSRYAPARMPHALRRVRDTRAQTTLTKTGRLENLAGAFFAPPLDGAFLYIVVDDVTTTGATLTEAVQALSAGGARHIVPIALSY